MSRRAVRGPRLPFLAAGVAALGLLVVSFYPWPAITALVAPPPADTAAPPESATVTPPPMTREAAPPGPRTVVVTLERGDTLLELLEDAGVSHGDGLAAMEALDRHLDFRRLQTGLDFRLLFVPQGDGEVLQELTVSPDITRTIALSRSGDSFAAHLDAVPVTHGMAAARLVIQSSLYDAAVAAGVPYGVLVEAVRIFSHEVDFQRDIHPGDKVEILFERSVTDAGKIVSAGPLLLARITLKDKSLAILRHTPGSGEADWFNPQGESIRKTLLRTPMDAIRITSGFGMRRHPVLGYSRMHRGLDFGAPAGTAVYAAGDGVVMEAGNKGAYGTYVRLRHASGLDTAYAHLSRLANGLKVGQQVRQGQVIGKVGSTGMSTGPHLHFEVHRKGEQVDPARLDLAAKRQLQGADLKAFRQAVKDREALIHALAKEPANPDVTASRASSVQVD